MYKESARPRFTEVISFASLDLDEVK